MGNRSPRLKVLISAYVCRPGYTSEPGLAWSYACLAARHHDVWIVTRARGRHVIEPVLARDPIPGLNFIYIDLPPWLLVFKKEGAPTQIYYYLWQAYAYFRLRKWVRNAKFDVAHHVTLVKYWAPSLLAFLGVPFVWGPVGGGESAPRDFWKGFSGRGKLYEVLRDSARWMAEHDPFVRLVARRCAVALATTEETAGRIRSIGAKRVRTVQAIALAEEDLDAFRRLPPRSAEECRFMSIGRLLHWKGFHLGIEAFAKANIPGSEYWIIGDGPEQDRLEALTAQLGIGERIRFWGRLTSEDTCQAMAECDVLVHPSLHESGGLVCLEAMAAGRPVICLDLGGPAIHVTEDAGIRVPASDQRRTIESLADAMEFIAQDRKRRAEMGKAGRARVASREYSWDYKAEIYTSLYREVIQPSPDEPYEWAGK